MTCTNPIMVKAIDGLGYMMVPCGKCIGCRLDKAREWSVRVVNEARMHQDSVVVTLTYDNEHMPENGSLRKSDYQKFLKLVRKRVYPDKIRYFLCGEYGDTFGRCHWHVIIFGISMYDARVFTGHTPDGRGHYVVNCSCWDKGRVVVDFLTRASASYIARYTMKKVDGHDNDWYEQQGLQPEFIAMSTKPGIGLSWAEKYSGDIKNFDYIVIDGVKFRIPRYYTKKMNLKDTLGYEIKQEDKHAKYIDELNSQDVKEWLKSGLKFQESLQQKSRNNKKFMEQKGR